VKNGKLVFKEKIMAFDNYPPNPDYLYSLDDIFLAINAYLNDNYSFNSVVSGSGFDSLVNDDNLIIESNLPCYILKNNKKIEIDKDDEKIPLILAFDNIQSHIERSILLNFLKSTPLKKFYLLMPFYKGETKQRINGHWNFATIYFNEGKNKCFFHNYEPLGDTQDPKNDPSLEANKFYLYVKKIYEDMNITFKNETTYTGQQRDIKLCGAIAALNCFKFIESQIISERKFSTTDEINALRQEQINKINSEPFAKRQFENYVFCGFTNNAYKKAHGIEIWHALKKLTLENDNFKTDLVTFFNEIEALEDNQKILSKLRSFFEDYVDHLSLDVLEKPLIKYFFKDEKNIKNSSVVDSYDIFEVLKCLSSQFKDHEQPDLNIKHEVTPEIHLKMEQYIRAQGFSNTYRGDEFQKLVGMKYAIELYRAKKPFKIYTESSEKEHDFGKFDDLIVVTEQKTTVIQVKHAGSIDREKRKYTVSMMGYGEKPTDHNKNKKVALYRYYDSWRKCQDLKLDRPFEFILYSNHELDNDLKAFYDEQTKTLDGLGKDGLKGIKKTHQKNLLDNIYMYSEYMRRDEIKKKLKNIHFILDKETDLLEIIDNKFNDFISKLGPKTIQKKDGLKPHYYCVIAFLMKNFFPYHNYEITLPEIEELQRITCKDKIQKKIYDEIIIQCSNKKNFSGRKKLTETYLKEKSVFGLIVIKENIYINNDCINIKVFEESAELVQAIFNQKGKKIKYDNNKINFDEQFEELLLDHLFFYEYRFQSIQCLDESIKKFIKDYELHINQSNIEQLEFEIAKQISQEFHLSDDRLYMEFSQYFLKNFRAPIGEEITHQSIKKIFTNAWANVERNRLVGYIERHMENIKNYKIEIFNKVDLNGFIKSQIESLDEAYKKKNIPVMVFRGDKNIGKSFAMCSWVENLKENKEKPIKNDEYAYLSLSKIRGTDINIFEKNLKLFVVDKIGLINKHSESKTILKKLISVAKESNNKKLVLVVNNDLIDTLLPEVINGIPHEIIQCKELSEEQIYQLTKNKPEHFIVTPYGYCSIMELLGTQINSGLAKSLYDLGQLTQLILSESIKDTEPQIESGDNTDIFIEQTVKLQDKINISEFIKYLSDQNILVYSADNDLKLNKIKNIFSEKINVKICNYIEYDGNKIKAENNDINVVLITSSQNIAELLKIIKNTSNLVIVVKSHENYLNLSNYIKNQCFLSKENEKSFQLIHADNGNKKMSFWNDSIDGSSYLESFLVRRADSLKKHILVADEAGMGKSTLVKRLVSTSKTKLKKSEYHWRIPVFLDQLTPQDNKASLLDFIFSSLNQFYNHKIPEFYRKILSHDLEIGNVLLLLDGGDQVKEYQTRECHEIYEKLLNYEHVVFLTRPEQSRLTFNFNERIQLEPFSQNQIEDYFKKAFPYNNGSNPFYHSAMQFILNSEKLQSLLGVPLQCNLLKVALRPYYDQWKQNRGKGEILIPLVNHNEYFLLNIFERFFDAKLHIYFSHNLKLNKDILNNLPQIKLLGKGYIERFSHVAVEQLFSDIMPFMDIQLPKPFANDWLEEELQNIALIKRSIISPDGHVTYVFGHRTFAEYAAAKFFVEGLTGLSQILPKQKKWCKEFLGIGRFINAYQQFWHFVFEWIQYHQSVDNLPAETFDQFKKRFFEYPDLIGGLEKNFWRSLKDPQSEFPVSYMPDCLDTRKSNDSLTNNASQDLHVHDSPIEKQFDSFDTVTSIIYSYAGNTFNYFDSDICNAIRDLAAHTDKDLIERLNLLKRAYRPFNEVHTSYNVHRAIAETLLKLALEDNEKYSTIVKYYMSNEYLEKNSKYFLYVSSALREAMWKIKINDYTKEMTNLISHMHKLVDISGELSQYKLDCLILIIDIVGDIIDIEKNILDDLKENFMNFINKILKSEQDWWIDEKSFHFINKLVSNNIKLGLSLAFDKLYKNKPNFLIMYLYVKNDKNLFPKDCSDSKRKIICNLVKSMYKNNFPKAVKFFQKHQCNVTDLILNKINFCDLEATDTLKDTTLSIKDVISEIDRLAETYTFEVNMENWGEIDAAIPAVCCAHDNLNFFLAAYLLYVKKNNGGQYIKALVKNIPNLLCFPIRKNDIYPAVAIYIYQKVLNDIVFASDKIVYDDFFDNSYMNVYNAIDYAWKTYHKTQFKEALEVINIYANHLKWPLIKGLNNSNQLKLITPATGHIESLVCDDHIDFDSVINFFSSKRKSSDTNGSDTSKSDINFKT